MGDPEQEQLQEYLDACDTAEVDVAGTRAAFDGLAEQVEPTVSVDHVDDGTVAGVRVRTYRPGEAGRLRLLWAHGGGWVAGTLDTTDPLCRALAVATGLEVVAVDYRLAPEHPFPAALDDLLAVVDGLTGPLAVGGDSAGAGLAAVAAQERRGVLVAQVLVSPLLDATLDSPSVAAFATGHGLTRNALEQYVALYLAGADPTDPRVSPLRTGDLAGTPPAVIVTGGQDPLRDDGAAYAARLREAGVRVEHRDWPEALHGFFGATAPTPTEDEALLWAADQLGAIMADRPPGHGPHR